MITTLSALVAALSVTSPATPGFIKERKPLGVFMNMSFGMGILPAATPKSKAAFELGLLIGRYFAVRPGWYIAPTIGYSHGKYDIYLSDREATIPWDLHRVLAGLRTGFMRRRLEAFLTVGAGYMIADPSNVTYTRGETLDTRLGADITSGIGLLGRLSQNIAVGPVLALCTAALDLRPDFRLSFPAAYVNLGLAAGATF